MSRLRQESSIANLSGAETSTWRIETLSALRALDRAEKLTWIRTLGDQRPSLEDFHSLAASRRYFYRQTLDRCAQLLRRYESPSSEDVTNLLTQRWFEPQRDWQLFELAVLMRIDHKFRTTATRERVRPPGWGGGAFAQYKWGTATVLLWYQSWPPSSAPSEQRDAIAHYKLTGTGSRPDIVIECIDGTTSKGLLLELKATENGDYLSQGLLQLLGYLRDRPSLFGREGDAWLVAPSNAINSESVLPDGRELWVLSGDEVADAAVQAIKQLARSGKP